MPIYAVGLLRAGGIRADMVILLSRTAVVGRTRKEAQEKWPKSNYKHASVEAALAHFATFRYRPVTL
ncbi:MAG: hypothetical protein U1E70_14110 [Acetobacteraceae bacterium]